MLNSFEHHLYLEAGTFHYQDGTIAFGGPRGEEIQSWDGSRKDRLKQLAPELRMAAKARHWLHHDAAYGSLDLVKVLGAMDYILFQFCGIKANTTPAPTLGAHPATPRWPVWSKVLTSIARTPQTSSPQQIDVTVQLVAMSQAMSIPISRINRSWLVGRVAELERAVEAVLAVRPAFDALSCYVVYQHVCWQRVPLLLGYASHVVWGPRL